MLTLLVDLLRVVIPLVPRPFPEAAAARLAWTALSPALIIFSSPVSRDPNDGNSVTLGGAESGLCVDVEGTVPEGKRTLDIEAVTAEKWVGPALRILPAPFSDSFAFEPSSARVLSEGVSICTLAGSFLGRETALALLAAVAAMTVLPFDVRGRRSEVGRRDSLLTVFVGVAFVEDGGRGNGFESVSTGLELTVGRGLIARVRDPFLDAPGNMGLFGTRLGGVLGVLALFLDIRGMRRVRPSDWAVGDIARGG